MLLPQLALDPPRFPQCLRENPAGFPHLSTITRTMCCELIPTFISSTSCLTLYTYCYVFYLHYSRAAQWYCAVVYIHVDAQSSYTTASLWSFSAIAFLQFANFTFSDLLLGFLSLHLFDPSKWVVLQTWWMALVYWLFIAIICKFIMGFSYAFDNHLFRIQR